MQIANRYKSHCFALYFLVWVWLFLLLLKEFLCIFLLTIFDSLLVPSSVLKCSQNISLTRVNDNEISVFLIMTFRYFIFSLNLILIVICSDFLYLIYLENMCICMTLISIFVVAIFTIQFTCPYNCFIKKMQPLRQSK